MKKYKLTKTYRSYPAGYVLEANRDGYFDFNGDEYSDFDLTHMVHTGFLEEVVENKSDEYWYVDTRLKAAKDVSDILSIHQARKDAGNYFATEADCLAAIERVKRVIK